MVAEDPGLSFAGLLRQLRAEAGFTQEELAEVAGVSARTVSDLERGVNRTAQKETARLLARALRLGESAAERFVAAARGRSPARIPAIPAVLEGERKQVTVLLCDLVRSGDPGAEMEAAGSHAAAARFFQDAPGRGAPL